mmetsp:Transcript_25002/g.54576  ORF Transcript_25002/g.54576 Transcript_25002/m.54576 type:complete len:85 (+) Transcript_25002:77-331(+)
MCRIDSATHFVEHRGDVADFVDPMPVQSQVMLPLHALLKVPNHRAADALFDLGAEQLEPFAACAFGDEHCAQCRKLFTKTPLLC